MLSSAGQWNVIGDGMLVGLPVSMVEGGRQVGGPECESGWKGQEPTG